METKSVVKAFSALAQETRLETLRHLVREGPSGLAAGDIAERLGVAPSTLSHHLATLENAGLVRSWRSARHIFYAAEVDGLRALIGYLTEDCCQGNPEICEGLGDARSFCKS